MIHRALTVLAVLLLTATSALAQKQPQPFIVPDPARIEHAVVTDEAGLQQWAEHEPVRCPNCQGKKTMTCKHCERFDDGDCEDCPECHNTRTAVCRICFGEGELPDILVKAPCPTCFGAALTTCFVCNGRGQFKVEGGGDRAQKCGCCDGVGAFPCTTCDGQRFVEPLKLKPSVAEAESKDLLKAMEVLEEVEAAISTFESRGKARDDIKALSKALKPGSRYFPVLRKVDQHFERVTKDQTKGAVWQHYEQSVANSAAMQKQALEYYLKYQKRLLQLCIARAEHNEGMKK